jgi:hypothetical protein
MDKNFDTALANLQAMCDSAVAWGRSVKLTFNGLKSFFMVFSSKRTLPSLPLKVDNVCVARSHSCLYLGLTIDDKLSWNTHISNKCAAVKKTFVPHSKMLSAVLGPLAQFNFSSM